MQGIIRHIRNFDWLLMGAVLFLMGLGLLSLFSLSASGSSTYFQRQLVWVAIGLFLLVIASLLDFRVFRTQSLVVFAFYTLSVLLLMALLAIGLKVRGHEAWLKYQNISFQPVEMAKLALIILLAKFFSKRHIEIYRIQHLVVSGIYLLIPAGLVLLQPDLGSAIILISIYLAVVIFSGMRLRHFLLLSSVLIIFSVVAWGFALKPYQKSRITTFLDPYNDPKGAGYQMIQSMIAVGSGQVWGKGLGYGSQSHLNFLPEAETDFIFATFAEEWGLFGSVIMIGLVIVVLWRIIYIGMHASDNFSRLYTLGFAAFIFMQSFIHIGMNMGTLPITGITLPFVSYGGSSLIILLIGLGILQNIKINSRIGIR